MPDVVPTAERAARPDTPAESGQLRPGRSVEVALTEPDPDPDPGEGPDSVTGTPEPAGPVKEVAEAALLAAGRRESIDTDENDGDQKKVSGPVAWTANSLALQVNSLSVDDQDAPAAEATVQIPVTPAPGYDKPADWESAYTGQPSFLYQVVITGLLVVQAVAKFFGFPFSVGSGALIRISTMALPRRS